ncbi:uncharacterized protein K460DRAFT_380026 [Cucurbitaria berberidis CBS 394.84]|uniref:Integral membrane protein n=1 Tax=Cucurbitaria berberidis CBS 394.84 TaxID=1168544 RepID=A0A9P4GA97_9PLEO|nr:uncharacterized protein K460DRAFT_380026 [Cucurbitaria berberidis CBS 394.84]KAF1842073.1 hypothetical protein K460DRAFT_380026 [Cucurbitaria berberidis CBS 394.84]
MPCMLPLKVTLTQRLSSQLSPRRNTAFRPTREPLRDDAALQLQHSRVTGPVPFLNPTRAHFRHEARPDVRFKWTSRNNRKGRHAIAISPHQVSAESKHDTPRASSSSGSIVHGIWRMLTYYPIWDISFDIAYVFTIGSVVWVMNAFFVFLPLVAPDTMFKKEELYGGGITAFIGATIFEFGSFLLMAEALNENRSGCFGWAVQHALSHKEEEEGKGARLRPSKSQCTHHHFNKRNLVGAGQNSASKHEPGADARSWVWWPSNEELRTHYIHSLGFLACLFQLLGATVFWISGLTALPGIYNRMSRPISIIFYWTPQVIGGTGFIISGSLFMLETQSKWWRPAPRTLGWWIGLWNLIGGIGFTMCPAFGYDQNSWAQYQACLSTFWGSWAFLIGSVIQWYESLDKFPVELKKSGTRQSQEPERVDDTKRAAA